MFAHTWCPHSGSVRPDGEFPGLTLGSLFPDAPQLQRRGFTLRPGARPPTPARRPLKRVVQGPDILHLTDGVPCLPPRYECRCQGRDANGHLCGGQGLPHLRGKAGGGPGLTLVGLRAQRGVGGRVGDTSLSHRVTCSTRGSGLERGEQMRRQNGREPGHCSGVG